MGQRLVGKKQKTGGKGEGKKGTKREIRHQNVRFSLSLRNSISDSVLRKSIIYFKADNSFETKLLLSLFFFPPQNYVFCKP